MCTYIYFFISQQQSACKSNSQGSFTNYNVDMMSESERKNVFEKFLQSKETAITLLYLDGSTQLRENVDINTKVKKVIYNNRFVYNYRLS